MQQIVPDTEHNPNDHTEEEILSALQGISGPRRFEFWYAHLNSANQRIGTLPDVLSGKVEQNWLADIKRKANFTLRDTGVIDFLQDRIQPWIRIQLPPYGPRDWAEWPQGVFLLATPKRETDSRYLVTREVEAFDPLLVYTDDAVVDRYSVLQGTLYTNAVLTLLGTTQVNLVPSTLTLPVTKEWEPGTSKLKIINDLLTAINYQSLSFDEVGVAVVVPYLSPADRPIEYVYADDDRSLILPDVEQELDLFSVANRWILVVSDPDKPALRAEYTNNDPASPTSTVRRQRVITDFRTEEEAASLGVLQEQVKKLAFEASQVYEAIPFKTGMMPIHSGNDVYRIVYDPLAINAVYSEHTWSMELRVGAQMNHRARRVVTV